MISVYKKANAFLNDYCVSKITLSIFITLYIFLLNIFTFDSINQVTSSIWLALLLLIIFLITSILPKIIFKLFLIIQIIITSIAAFSKITYNLTITTDIMLSALMNESDLTSEMVSINFITWVLISALLPSLLLVLIKIKHQPFIKYFIKSLMIVLACFAFIYSYFLINDYNFRSKGNIRDPRFVSDLSQFSPLDVEYNLNRASRAKKKLIELQDNIENLSQKYPYQKTMEDVLVVLVIGETTRGDHFQLNGYSRNTNPRLATIENLYSFKNATSCDTLTVNSVYCLSSPMLKTNDSRVPKQSSFAEVMHSLGYKNEIYSLQTMSNFYNYLHYDKLISKYQVLNEQHKGSKDIALLPYAKKAIDDVSNKPKLIVLHTLGSHQTYADRLSDKYEKFTPYCKNPDVNACQSDELNNAFDNTVIAVDDFLATVIDNLKDKKAILIYASDHGESLGENGHYFHGMPIDIAPKEQFDIPFLVWFSDAYIADEKGHQLANNLKNNWAYNQKLSSDLPLKKTPNVTTKNLSSDTITLPIDNKSGLVSHDNIFHTILGCAGIESIDGIDKQLNLCAE